MFFRQSVAKISPIRRFLKEREISGLSVYGHCLSLAGFDAEVFDSIAIADILHHLPDEA
jgi:hypothetical protein